MTRGSGNKQGSQEGVQYSIPSTDWCTLFLAEPCPGADGEEDKVVAILGSHEFKGCTFRVERGDYSGILKKVAENLDKAKVLCIIRLPYRFQKCYPVLSVNI